MKIYLLQFQEGEYSDYSEIFLGAYSSIENREAAKLRYGNRKDGRFKEHFSKYGPDSKFSEWEVTLDEDFYQ